MNESVSSEILIHQYKYSIHNTNQHRHIISIWITVEEWEHQEDRDPALDRAVQTPLDTEEDEMLETETEEISAKK